MAKNQPVHQERKNQPVHQERLGRIKAVVWENPTQNGSMFNVTFSRTYKDGDEWKESQSFGRDDCLLVARLAEMASVWIYRYQAEQAAERDVA
jgi:hypothetical protein